MMSNAAPLPPTMVELALYYAAQGLRVFPLNGKVPAIPGGSGCLDATTDPDTIREMWRRYPYANVGLAAGPESGFFAIDLDGPDARRAWMKLTDTCGAISTRCARTGRADGGLHLFFRWPTGGVPNRPEGAWSERVLGHRRMGVIADGRYVVAVGSIHPDTGQQYDWDDERVDIAEPPEWLIAKIRDERRERQDPWSVPITQPRANGYARQALENEYDACASALEGERNNQLNISAFNLGQLVASGELTEGEVFETLLAACRRNGVIGEGERRCRSTILSGIEGGKKKPRSPRPKEEDRDSGVYATPETKQTSAAPDSVATPSSVLASWKTSGPLLHEPTGLPRLDAATGGGPVYGRLWVIPGAPNAAKTFLLVHILHEYALRGILVGLLAVDEEADDIVTRLAQRVGFSRVACEIRVGAEVDAIAKRLGELTIRIYDADWTIDAAAQDLAKHAQELGVKAMLAVDSLQQVTCAAETMAKRELSEHQAIGARIRALKGNARRLSLIALTTSEMPRAQYRSKSARQDASPIAAAKGSGAVEYGARVQLNMTSLSGTPDIVMLELSKNKQGPDLIGEEDAIYIRIDRDSQRLEETVRPGSEPEPKDVEDSGEHERLEKLCNRFVLALVQAKGPVTTRADLLALVRARKSDGQRAISMLITSGRIRGGNGVQFTAVYSEGVDEN